MVKLWEFLIKRFGPLEPWNSSLDYDQFGQGTLGNFSQDWDVALALKQRDLLGVAMCIRQPIITHTVYINSAHIIMCMCTAHTSIYLHVI